MAEADPNPLRDFISKEPDNATTEPPKFKTVVMVGGYTILHLFLKLYKKQYARIKDLQFELHLSHHFTEETQKSLLKLPWGQDRKGFPEESRTFLPNWISDHLTIASVKLFNIKAVQYLRSLKNVDVYQYKKGLLKINSSEKEFIIIAEDDNTRKTYARRYQTASTYLVDCILKPREHLTQDFRTFIITEQFFQSDIKKLQLPILIFGKGPASLWVAQICLDHHKQFMFYDHDAEKVLNANFGKHPRNSKILKKLRGHFYQGELVYNAEQYLTKNVGKNMYDSINEEIQRILEADSSLKTNMLAVVFDKLQKNYTLFKGVLCIGYQTVNYDCLNLPYHSSISAKVEETKEDVSPLSLQGSVYHQLSKGYLAFGRMLGINEIELLHQNGFNELFLNHEEIKMLKHYFNLADITIDASLYQELQIKAREEQYPPRTKAKVIKFILDALGVKDDQISLAIKSAYNPKVKAFLKMLLRDQSLAEKCNFYCPCLSR